MKKLAFSFAVLMTLVVAFIVGRYSVRYTDYLKNGEKFEMKSEDFHFRLNLDESPNYKIVGVHYHIVFDNEYGIYNPILPSAEKLPGLNLQDRYKLAQIQMKYIIETKKKLMVLYNKYNHRSDVVKEKELISFLNNLPSGSWYDVNRILEETKVVIPLGSVKKISKFSHIEATEMRGSLLPLARWRYTKYLQFSSLPVYQLGNSYFYLSNSQPIEVNLSYGDSFWHPLAINNSDMKLLARKANKNVNNMLSELKKQYYEDKLYDEGIPIFLFENKRTQKLSNYIELINLVGKRNQIYVHERDSINGKPMYRDLVNSPESTWCSEEYKKSSNAFHNNAYMIKVKENYVIYFLDTLNLYNLYVSDRNYYMKRFLDLIEETEGLLKSNPSFYIFLKFSIITLFSPFLSVTFPVSAMIVSFTSISLLVSKSLLNTTASMLPV